MFFFHDFQVLSTDVEACKGNAGYRLASRSGQSVSKDAAAAHVGRVALKYITFYSARTASLSDAFQDHALVFGQLRNFH